MLTITLINPETQRPYPHTQIEHPDTGDVRTIYSIEDWQPVTVSLELDTNGRTVELLLAFDGCDGFVDGENDTVPVTSKTVGRMTDQGVFVRGAEWFTADNGASRGTKSMAGTVWAAYFYGSPIHGVWARGMARGPIVAMVEYDSQEHLLARGIVVPILSPFNPFDQLGLKQPVRKGVGLTDC